MSRVFIKTDHLMLRCDYCDVPVFGNNQKSQQELVSLPDGLPGEIGITARVDLQ